MTGHTHPPVASAALAAVLTETPPTSDRFPATAVVR